MENVVTTFTYRDQVAMIISCPNCPAKLNLPESSEGKLIRCPRCKEVFRANAEILEVGKPPLSAEPTPEEPPVPQESREDSEEQAAGWGYTAEQAERKKRDKPPQSPKPLSESEITEWAARRYVNPAGVTMLAAAVLTAVTVLFNLSMGIQASLDVHEKVRRLEAQPRIQFRPDVLEFEVKEQARTPVSGPCVPVGCTVMFFGPAVLCVLIGGRNLLTFGPRGVIITAVVIEVFLALVLALGVIAIQYLSEWVDVSLGKFLPSLVMNSLSCILHLLGAALAVRALLNADVAKVYRTHAERAEAAEDAAQTPPDEEEAELPESAAPDSYQNLVSQAKAKTQPAGLAMFLSGLIIGASIFLNLMHWGSTLQDFRLPVQGESDLGLTAICFLAPLVLFVFVAGRNLYVLSGRAPIHLGICVVFILIVIVGSGTLFHLETFVHDRAPKTMHAQLILLNVVTCAFALIAAILSIVALSTRAVRDAYDPLPIASKILD